MEGKDTLAFTICKDDTFKWFQDYILRGEQLQNMRVYFARSRSAAEFDELKGKPVSDDKSGITIT